MKKYLFTILFIAELTVCLGGKWVRYNMAGYDPVRPKKAIVMADNNCSGYAWRLRNSSSSVVLSGTLAASVTGTGNYMPKAFNHEIDFSSIETQGTYTLEVDNIGNYSISISCHPYSFLLSQVLRTIRVRRSGSNDALDHAISHLGDASCRVYDRVGTNNGNWTPSADNKYVDMAGGFYDAGDYIKFTLTNAYLTYFMLRSYETAPALFDGVKLYSTTSLDDLLDESKWGLDFLMKTMPDANEFIIQTGGAADHNEPNRLPENDALDGSRECYSSFSRPQMGLTAAALALGSKIFEAKGLTTEANNYKAKAIEIYTAAKTSGTATAWWQGGGEVFYQDATWRDNMELAAIELYLLTNTASYLTDAQTYGNAAGSAGWSSWGDINVTAHSRLLPFYPAIETSITDDLDYFLSVANATNNRWKIPHESVWGSLYSQFSVAHSAMQYKSVSSVTTYDQFGYDVVDYTFGRNAWGLGFIASQSLSNTITSSYASIYKLQPSKFPTGEIAEGPAPAIEHSDNEPYFSPAHNPSLWHSQFNTSDFTFFEEPGDYVCMETTICGLADGLFFLTLATQSFCSDPLPVTLSAFDVKLIDSQVNVTWSISEEKQGGYFSVERSADGVNFISVGTEYVVSDVYNFSFTDAQPLPGLNYYRLAQYDEDGSVYYSEVKNVSLDRETEVTIFPNPIHREFKIVSESISMEKAVISDMTGKIIFQITNIAPSYLIELPEEIPEGIYLLTVFHDRTRQVFKIIIRN